MYLHLNFPIGIPVMYCLLEVVSVCPEKLAPRFADKIDWIKVSSISCTKFLKIILQVIFNAHFTFVIQISCNHILLSESDEHQ